MRISTLIVYILAVMQTSCVPAHFSLHVYLCHCGEYINARIVANDEDGAYQQMYKIRDDLFKNRTFNNMEYQVSCEEISPLEE